MVSPAKDTPLRQKFEHVVDYDRAKAIAKKQPDYLFPCLLESRRPMKKWPEGVHLGSNINDRFYTVHATFDQLEKIGANTAVKRPTIR